MLPLAATQCSIWFTVLQSIVGGLFGSIGFFVNVLVIRWGMMKYQEYKQTKETSNGPGTASTANRDGRRAIS